MPDIATFFEDSRSDSKLVWCNDNLQTINMIRKAAEARGLKVEIDCEDLTLIRDMEGRCLIVTEEELMRGVDYRLATTEG